MWRSIIVGLALICLGLLGYYAVAKRGPQITGALQAAANNAIAAKVPGVVVEMTQRDAIVKGTVQSVDDRALVEKTVRAVSGIKDVDVRLVVVTPPRVEEPKGPDAPPTIEAPARPASLEVKWDGKALVVTGDVPADLKKELAGLFASEFPGASINDQTQVAGASAQPEVVKPFRAAVRALARTTNGTLHVTEADFELTGQVSSAEADAAIKTSVDTDLKALMSTVTITIAAQADADAVAESEDAAVEVEEVAVAEEVTSPADAAAPPSTGPLTNAQCQSAIDAAIDGDKRITFAGPTGTLSPEGIAKVEEVWALLQRCPDAKGLIVGYHDDLGEPDKMKQRTSIRAFSVHKKLVELGMDKTRFKHSGYGQRDFKYPNAGATRALNQRVELKIEVQ